MDLFGEIVQSVFLTEGIATVSNVNDAINNLQAVEIRYTAVDKNNQAVGRRIIYPVAYGLTKAGNPVIRAYEPYGDTHTKVPAWKFFLLNGIRKWRPLKNKTFQGEKLEGFNPDGDLSMSVVYNIANVDGRPKDFKPADVKVSAVNKTDIDPQAKDKYTKPQEPDKKISSKEVIDNLLQGAEVPTGSVSKDDINNINDPLKGIKAQLNQPKRTVSPEVLAQIEKDNERRKARLAKKQNANLDNVNINNDIANKQSKLFAPQTRAINKTDIEPNKVVNRNQKTKEIPTSPFYKDELDNNNGN